MQPPQSACCSCSQPSVALSVAVSELRELRIRGWAVDSGHWAVGRVADTGGAFVQFVVIGDSTMHAGAAEAQCRLTAPITHTHSHTVTDLPNISLFVLSFPP